MEKDGIEVEIKICPRCKEIPYINSMPHGERWIDCDCGLSSGLYKDDNNPSLALKKAVDVWNKKRGKRVKKNEQ